MAKCQAQTRKGKPCPHEGATIDPVSGEFRCHLHHPQRKFQQRVAARREYRRLHPYRNGHEEMLSKRERCAAPGRGGRKCNSRATWLDPQTGDHRCGVHHSLGWVAEKFGFKADKHNVAPLRTPQDMGIASKEFWRHVRKTDGCWEWAGSIGNGGYGRVSTGGGKQMAASRVSWILHFGPIPDGMYVCHHCDNPPCTNPAHLFLGTAQDNFDDCLKKGRHILCRKD